MIGREAFLFGLALVLMLVAAFLMWVIFFSTPYTFRSDCRQIAANGWECSQP
jgi:hypothetical protein